MERELTCHIMFSKTTIVTNPCSKGHKLFFHSGHEENNFLRTSFLLRQNQALREAEKPGEQTTSFLGFRHKVTVFSKAGTSRTCFHVNSFS